ncbi:hypothetical protein V8E36_001101 [Tilletia maclaganii]
METKQRSSPLPVCLGVLSAFVWIAVFFPPELPGVRVVGDPPPPPEASRERHGIGEPGVEAEAKVEGEADDDERPGVSPGVEGCLDRAWASTALPARLPHSCASVLHSHPVSPHPAHQIEYEEVITLQTA